MTVPFPKGGSEYGGYPGLIQPEPHDPADKPHEQLMLTYLADADDPLNTEGTPEAVLEKIRKDGRGRVNR